MINQASLAQMLRVSVTELKNKLSHYLRLVKRGEIIEVLEHSVPIATLQGLQSKAVSRDAHLDRLVRDGIITAASKKPNLALLKKPPIRSKLDPAKILVEERGDR